jgi:hypothetical protein
MAAEQALAFRYYYRVQNDATVYLALSPGPAINATRLFGMITLPGAMRGTPAVSHLGQFVTNFTANLDSITSLYLYSSANNRELMLDCTATSNLTTNT